MKKKSGGVAITDAIYKVYPRHIGKRAAVRAIQNAVQRLIQGESGTLMEWRAAEAFLASKSSEFAHSIAGSRGVFTPHPSTWFNQSRYLDDVEEWNRVEGNRLSAAQEKQDRTRENLTAAIRNRFSSDAGQGGGEDGTRSDAGGERRLDRTLGAGTQPRH